MASGKNTDVFKGYEKSKRNYSKLKKKWEKMSLKFRKSSFSQRDIHYLRNE